jgi:uncharacterized membrane protein
MFARHRRFVLSLMLGAALGGAGWLWGLSAARAILLAADSAFLIYLGLMARFVHGMTPEDLRRHSELSDEGVPLIAALALGSVGLSLGAIALAMNHGNTLEVALAVASVPLGWTVLHVLAAFHYAALWYDRGAKGLNFPGSKTPGPWDFLYFSFTVGMTAQVSDVIVERAALRRLVLAHGVVSFFYNTVILALAVNVAVG